MIAGLPMYDWPELMVAHDRLWAEIRDALRARDFAAPEGLTRTIGLWDLWSSPQLVLGQTCGMPYRQRLHDKVELIGAFNYGLADTPHGYYHSVLVTRQGDAADIGDYADKILAFNGQDSQSGWAAAQNHAAARGFQFAKTLHTGAHRASAEAVADGRADIASIDAVTWRIICAYRPGVAARLTVVDRTVPTPGLPLIAAKGQNVSALRAGVEEALSRLSPEVSAALGLSGKLAIIPTDAYLAVPTPAAPSQDAPAA